MVQTFSADDLNTADHYCPANLPHAMLIQGTVPDTMGLGENNQAFLQVQGLCTVTGAVGCADSNLPVGTFSRNSNVVDVVAVNRSGLVGYPGEVRVGVRR